MNARQIGKSQAMEAEVLRWAEQQEQIAILAAAVKITKGE